MLLSFRKQWLALMNTVVCHFVLVRVSFHCSLKDTRLRAQWLHKICRTGLNIRRYAADISKRVKFILMLRVDGF